MLGSRRLGLILLVIAVLLGSAAAFTRTERLKLQESPIGAGRFERWLSPGCGCPAATAEMRLRIRSAERLDVVVVDSEASPVRTLARDSAQSPGRFVLEWDGRDDGGSVVPDGAYRLRVRLREARRTIFIPVEVHVDTTPPTVRSFSAARATFSPDGDGVDDRLVLNYATSEAALPILLVDGEEAVRGELRSKLKARLRWDGTLGVGTVATGVHEVSLILVDRAGNRSEPSADVAIFATTSAEAP